MVPTVESVAQGWTGATVVSALPSELGHQSSTPRHGEHPASDERHLSLPGRRQPALISNCPRPLNSVRREHVNPQEIGGAKETTASASQIASDRGDGLDNPAGPCGLAGRERRLPPAVPTLAPDPPPVRYEPRRATEATAARRAGERRKLSQHSKSSRPPRSNANDGCASLLLTCLFCRCREPCLTLPLRCCLVALLAPLCRACGRAGACCPCDPHRLCRPPADAAAATPPQSPPTSPPRRGVHTARGSLIDEVHVRPKFDFAPCEECCEVVEVVDLCIECSNLCFRA
ncbi:unnamed protein product [Lampetra planeri]